jgi:hypothetical protein
MSKIMIGKHTLESLTSGMYSEPFVIYREYIQNAVDSIDAAFRQGYLVPGKECVSINIDYADGIIEIYDNGLGLSIQDAEQTLISIGSSKKNAKTSRGFRGIGRLAALSYCNKLIFATTYPGEKIGTKVTIDALKLSELLSIYSQEDSSMEDVLKLVCTSEHFAADESEHYFKVSMYDVDNAGDLLNINSVKEYLSQVAPVPYDPNAFTWRKEVIDRLRQHGYDLSQYCIQICCGINKFNIYKPYQDTILIDKARNNFDVIQDIEILELHNSDGVLTAIAWIALTNYVGTIVDRTVKGLRIRKGNILIGDSQTLNTVFKDARFNGWTLGEIFVLDPMLLPNARRDNFEKTPAFFLFSEQMATIAGNISKQIRIASIKRNSGLAEAIQKTEEANNAVKGMMKEAHISPGKKGSVSQKIHLAQQEMSNILPQNDTESLLQEIAFDELDMLIGKVQGVTLFKAINILETLSKTEKKILEQVFCILQNQLCDEDVEKVIEAILTQFTKKSQFI